MRKILFVAGMLTYMTTLGMETAHAQQVSLDVAIQRAAMELSAGIDRGARIAVLSMEADTAGMSNYLIGEMMSAFIRMGFIVVDGSQLNQVTPEQGVQFIVNGTFVSLGDFFHFRILLTEAETGTVRGMHTANVQHDSVIAALLGDPARGVTHAPRQVGADRRLDRVNWFSLEIVGLGAGISYMRDINDWFSIGGIAWLDANLSLFHGGGFSFGAKATARFFPGGFPFFMELGLGFGYAHWLNEWWDGGRHVDIIGIVIAPTIGVRLGGQTGGFFASPSIGYSFVIGSDFAASPRVGAGIGWAW